MRKYFVSAALTAAGLVALLVAGGAIGWRRH